MKIKTNIQNLKNYKIQLRVEQAVHEFMKKKGYLKLDLPVMSPALIPESYLEIFETEFNYFDRKEKLYLTPSPELFMKRPLTQGIGNIYYLGKSFRNSEPNSSFHSPEFTMLEFYKVGATYLELAEQILEIMKFISSSLSFRAKSRNPIQSPMREISPLAALGRNDSDIIYKGKKISFEKWEKFTVAKAFDKFCQISKEELFDENLFLKRAQEKGYAISYSSSPESKFGINSVDNPDKNRDRQARTINFSYQDVFSQILSQEVEPKLGKNGYPTLLYDYPAEMSSLAKLNKDRKTAKRVEFYIDGIEIGGCCEELNDWHEQKKRFDDQIEKRDRFHMKNHAVDNGFIETLQYGLPDCTGAGIGFERLAMIFVDAQSIGKLKLINVK